MYCLQCKYAELVKLVYIYINNSNKGYIDILHTDYNIQYISKKRAINI